MDVRQHYRRTISYHQYEFNWDVMRLKKKKENLDLHILIGSDVIGMTTTGKKFKKNTYTLIHIFSCLHFYLL